MRNSIKIFLIITILFIAFNEKKDEILSVFEIDQYTATSDLNVRTGAGSNFPILFTLKEGEEVEVQSKNGNWFLLIHQNRRGYAYSKYLEPIVTSHLNPLSMPNIAIGAISVIIISIIVFNIIKRIRNKRLLESATKLERGTWSERDLVLNLLKSGIPAQAIFHDLYVEKGDGHFSQIDLVLVSNVGIIVIEVKDYSGWIYGNGNQRQWTKVLAYGKEKYRFYNPIMQNHQHILALSKILNLTDTVPFYSVVLFYGDCELKDISFVPKNTFISRSDRVFEVLDVIIKNNPPVQYSDRNEVVRLLSEAVKNGGFVGNQLQHIENVKDMLGTDRIFN